MKLSLRIHYLIEKFNPFWYFNSNHLTLRELFKKIKIYNDIIVENKTKKYRINVLTMLDHMIEKMKNHLEAHKTGPDLRNKFLCSLRMISENIRKARDIAAINHLKNGAEDKFDLY
jgi:hypothetical protein